MVDLVERLLDPDMSAQELRLHMGELSAQEVRTARAAIRWANTRLHAALGAEERRGLEPTEDMIEAAAKAIHDHWQNGPGPHARTWAKCCRDLPAAAADFRAKARVGLVAALIPEAPVREAE